MTPEQRTCINCGNAFVIKRRRENRPQHFCSHRCYHDHQEPDLPMPKLPKGFGDWFAGFTDGEAHFSLSVRMRSNVICPGFSIGLREDDVAILECILKTLGIGHLHHVKRAHNKTHNAINWQVSSIRECWLLVKIFKTHLLRSKKQRDFETWSKAIEEKRKGVNQDKERLLALRQELIAKREWGSDPSHIRYQYHFRTDIHAKKTQQRVAHCLNCQKEFTVWPGTTGKFCSQPCYHSYRPPGQFAKCE